MWTLKAVTAAMLVACVLGFSVGDEIDHGKGKGKTWAVLVAGSSSWFNYRHQADVCHAYQILKSHGIPDERIIVMMTDDIAHSEMNPTKGKIINRPGGPNVYEGVPKDYTGKTVTPKNFLKLLSGANMTGIGSGKSLNSGPHDRIFLNLVDHGAPGIFGFPVDFLYAKDLMATITAMHHSKMFREMVIYLESCESGSMFDKLLPEDINVFAVTASNSTSSSYACYYDEKIHNYLGDVFSIKWMEDSDKEDLSKETLSKQFEIVKKETTTSPVEKFGEMSISKEVVADYLGKKKSSSANTILPPDIEDACSNSTMSSPDVPVSILEMMMSQAKTQTELKEAKDRYVQLHKNREFVRDIVRKIALTLTNSAELTEEITDEHQVSSITQWECYHTAAERFHERCFNLGSNSYALRHVKTFSNLCDQGFSNQEINTVIDSICTHPQMINIH